MLTTAFLAAMGPVTGLLTGPTLRRLPEPPDALAEGKVPYGQLASRRFALGVAACSVAALLVVAGRTEPALWPAWLPLATIGTLLVAIDAVTTWLPLRLTHVLWGTSAVSLSISIALSPGPDRAALSLRVLAGAAVVGGFFWLVWWLTGSLGFGDVRLAPVLGATAATVSWSTVITALVAGTLAGALHGIVRRLRGRSGPFPYGPALVVGVFVALASAT